MSLGSIVARYSCLSYGLQTNFTVTHIRVRKVNALQASLMFLNSFSKSSQKLFLRLFIFLIYI